MANLIHLQLVGNRLCNVGLRAILDGCPLLESLDLRQCNHVKLEKLGRRCDELVKDFREPNASLDGFRFGGLPFYDYEKACLEAQWDYRVNGSYNKKLLQAMEKLKRKKLWRLEAQVADNEERFAKSGELSRNLEVGYEEGEADWEMYAIWGRKKVKDYIKDF